MKRTSIRRVSSKRKQALTEYGKRRIDYLLIHPHCQIFLKFHNITESDVTNVEEFSHNEFYSGMAIIIDGDGFNHTEVVPRATTIHHTKKPKATYLNDEKTWLGGSWEWHEWVENNKKEAREKGLLENI